MKQEQSFIKSLIELIPLILFFIIESETKLFLRLMKKIRIFFKYET